MKTWTTTFASALTILAFAGKGAHGQAPGNRAEIVPLAGYVLFDDMLRGPIGTSLSNSNGGMVGLQLGVPIAGPISLFAGGAYARSDLTVGLPLLGGLSVAATDAWLFDGGLQFRPTGEGTITPIVQLGVGAAHYRIGNSVLDTESTNAAATVGGGVDLNLTPMLGIRVMAKDYIGKFDFREAVFADIEGRSGHNIGLMAGLRIRM